MKPRAPVVILAPEPEVPNPTIIEVANDVIDLDLEGRDIELAVSHDDDDDDNVETRLFAARSAFHVIVPPPNAEADLEIEIEPDFEIEVEVEIDAESVAVAPRSTSWRRRSVLAVAILAIAGAVSHGHRVGLPDLLHAQGPAPAPAPVAEVAVSIAPFTVERAATNPVEPPTTDVAPAPAKAEVPALETAPAKNAWARPTASNEAAVMNAPSSEPDLATSQE